MTLKTECQRQGVIVIAANATGGYSCKQIGDCFGCTSKQWEKLSGAVDNTKWKMVWYATYIDLTPRPA